MDIHTLSFKALSVRGKWDWLFLGYLISAIFGELVAVLISIISIVEYQIIIPEIAVIPSCCLLSLCYYRLRLLCVTMVRRGGCIVFMEADLIILFSFRLWDSMIEVQEGMEISSHLVP